MTDSGRETGTSREGVQLRLPALTDDEAAIAFSRQARSTA